MGGMWQRLGVTALQPCMWASYAAHFSGHTDRDLCPPPSLPQTPGHHLEGHWKKAS